MTAYNDSAAPDGKREDSEQKPCDLERYGDCDCLDCREFNQSLRRFYEQTLRYAAKWYPNADNEDTP